MPLCLNSNMLVSHSPIAPLLEFEHARHDHSRGDGSEDEAEREPHEGRQAENGNCRGEGRRGWDRMRSSGKGRV